MHVHWDDGGPNTTSRRHVGLLGEPNVHRQGMYTVTLKVTDDDDGVSNTLSIIISVYDPDGGGFVTGGGWIKSPAGSYPAT